MANKNGWDFDGKNQTLRLPSGGVLDLRDITALFGTFAIDYVEQTTTDNTATTVFSRACAAASTVGALVFAIATIPDTSDDGLVAMVYNAVKNANGTTAVVGSTGGSNVESAAGSPVVTIVANDTTDAMDIKVTGENSKTYNWKLLIIHGAVA